MFWSQPKPWAKMIGRPDARPVTVTLFRAATAMRGAYRPAHYRSCLREPGGLRHGVRRSRSGPASPGELVDHRSLFVVETGGSRAARPRSLPARALVPRARGSIPLSAQPSLD